MGENEVRYNVKAGEFDFTFTAAQMVSVDIVKKNAETFSIIYDHQSIEAIVTPATNRKKLTVEVEGERFDVEIKDELDQMLEQMGFGIASARQVKEIKAPMPGLVLEISVTEGQEVKEGNRLLILEAMKMENGIMISNDATIKTIKVKAGQAVEKGQVLVELA